MTKADEDLAVAQELMERQRVSYNPVGFHAQQAAEKYLKALLTRHGIEFPRTHNIEALLLLADAVERGIHDALGQAHTLTPYGVDVRYPGEIPPLSREGAIEALQIASRLRDAVMDRLRPYLQRGKPEAGE